MPPPPPAALVWPSGTEFAAAVAAGNGGGYAQVQTPPARSGFTAISTIISRPVSGAAGAPGVATLEGGGFGGGVVVKGRLGPDRMSHQETAPAVRKQMPSLSEICQQERS